MKKDPTLETNNFFEIKHPILQHKMALLRDIKTNKKQFRELVYEIAQLLAYEAMRGLTLHEGTIQTPLETIKANSLNEQNIVILPILRAGIGMAEGFSDLLPLARVGHIGCRRDEKTLESHCYYFNIPAKSKSASFFICDPMLATGGTSVEAVNRLKQEGIKDITFVCILAAPEGVKRLHDAHPDIPIYTAALDRQLNQKGYILPGLGDAGDRLFGT